jgi:hypothetical protein
MLAYLMTEVAAIVCTVAGRFRQTRAGDGGRVLGVGLPFIGVVVLATVLWYNVKGPQVLWTSPACAGLAWSAIGLLAALLARRACCGCAPRWPWSWGSL